MRSARSRPSQSLALALTTTAVLWGALAFGAVYPWGYWTLAALNVAAGIAGILSFRPKSSISPAMWAGLVAILLAVSLQLVPISRPLLAILNPSAPDLLTRLEPSFALIPGLHPLSITPSKTRLALLLYVSLATLVVGVASLASAGGGRRLVERLIAAGVLLAFVGIIQKPLYAGRIYGFWTPIDTGNPFGPFVNRNHFAGWMLMVIPVALGYSCASIARGLRGVPPGARTRLLWLSSADASKWVLAGVAVVVMALSLVLTLSRSGIGSLCAIVLMTSVLAMRKVGGRTRRIVALAYFVFVVVSLVSVVDVGTIVARFQSQGWGGVIGRAGGWADAIATFQRHWLTGTGLNTYQFANIFYQQHDLDAFMSAAHNDYLQLASEGGLLLLLPIAFCVAIFIRDVRRRFREDGESSAYWLRAGAVTGLLAIGLQETVDFSLQIPGNATMFAVLCGLALHSSQRSKSAAPVTLP